ncbi:hypothetical protein [Occultella gossypii]|uniref:Uncharacterized protein n=1 Tax=Occultella gossypii TaxID=2800820 RepID=A0ABS7SB67_9MICO|nr:hypothetical protein [Occultella gossypii]MBZ2197601.1 hypothetical protein [Occultella gossypii]
MSTPGPLSSIREWMFGWDVNTPRERPLPPVEIDVGRWVPAWAVRVVAGLAVLAAGVLLTADPTQLALAAALGVGVAIGPQGAIPMIALVAGIIAFAVREPSPAVGAGLLLCLHGMHYLTRRVSGLSPRARVELAALRRGLVPALVLQGFAQLVGVVVWILPGPASPFPWLAVLALIAITILVLVGVRALRAAEAGPGPRRMPAKPSRGTTDSTPPGPGGDRTSSGAPPQDGGEPPAARPTWRSVDPDA